MSGLDMRKLCVKVFIASAVFGIVFCGCISDQGTFNNITVSGYIKRAVDSAAVPGALVMIDIDILDEKSDGVYSNAEGYFKYHRTFPTYNWNTIEAVITVADMDGENNGVFVSQDTTLYDDNEEGELDIDFSVDLYVQIVEDTTKTNPVPFAAE